MRQKFKFAYINANLKLRRIKLLKYKPKKNYGYWL